MKVTILAGELGTRLSEETTARPKPMVKLLDYQDAYSFFKAAHLERGYSNFARMPHALIQAIRNRVDQINGDGGEQLHGLKPGEIVVIQDGPFAGRSAKPSLTPVSPVMSVCAFCSACCAAVRWRLSSLSRHAQRADRTKKIANWFGARSAGRLVVVIK